VPVRPLDPPLRHLLIARRGCDLIAREIRGCRGLARRFLGSVADQVVGDSSVTVFAHRSLPR
jgi:nucleotide-binding universal stress UspA family protein